MAFSFNSIGHFFAKAFHAISKGVAVAQKAEAPVEGVTAVVDPALLAPERAAFAILGEIASILHLGGEAAASKLTDVGVDVAIVKQVQALVAGHPDVAEVAASLK